MEQKTEKQVNMFRKKWEQK